MRFAYHPSMCDPSYYLELGKAAESAGFDVITFPDSICYPKECDSTYPYNDDGSREFLDGVPFLEPFSIIPAIAGIMLNGSRNGTPSRNSLEPSSLYGYVESHSFG